jgi:hypothetical protein
LISKDYTKLKRHELIKLCKGKNIKHTGKKIPDLIVFLTNTDQNLSSDNSFDRNNEQKISATIPDLSTDKIYTRMSKRTSKQLRTYQQTQSIQ